MRLLDFGFEDVPLSVGTARIQASPISSCKSAEPATTDLKHHSAATNGMNARDLLLTLLLGILLAVLGSAILRTMIRRASLNSNHNTLSPGHPQYVDAPLSVPRIASLLTEYYDLLIHLSYFTRSVIAFPPHIIDTDLCTRLNLSAPVIAPMRSIPFPKSYTLSFNNPTFPCSRAFVFTDPEDIVASRDPCMPLREAGYDEDLAGPEIPPYILPLSRDMVMECDFDGWIILRDTRTATIRSWGQGITRLPDNQQPPNDGTSEDQNHYRNLPTRAAEEVLGEMVESLRTLKWIPMVELGRGRIVREWGWREWRALRDGMLDMGWGTERWNVEEWERVREGVLQEKKDRQWEVDRRNGEPPDKALPALVAGHMEIALEIMLPP